MMNVEHFLGLVLSYFPTESLQKLALALAQNRVIARAYQDARGHGCLLNCLEGSINSREMRIRTFAFDPQLLEASEHLVRAWDLGVLTPETVQAHLKRVLAQRARFEKEHAARRTVEVIA